MEDLWVDGQALRMNGVTQTIDEALAWNELDLAVETYYEGIE